MSNYQQWYDAYVKGLDEARDRLSSFRPSRIALRKGLQERLEAIDPLVRALSLEEFEKTVLRPPRGSVLWEYKDVTSAIRDASDPMVEIADCKEGVLYRVRCRNSNCGIWVPAERGFEIARTKFDSDYLFVEYHWETGAPFGTARPYEVLEALPPFANDEERLQYLLVWRTKLGSY